MMNVMYTMRERRMTLMFLGIWVKDLGGGQMGSGDSKGLGLATMHLRCL